MKCLSDTFEMWWSSKQAIFHFQMLWELYKVPNQAGLGLYYLEIGFQSKSNRNKKTFDPVWLWNPGILDKQGDFENDDSRKIILKNL